MFWWCQSVLCILLMCMTFQSFASPLGQRGSLTFSHSLRLTRTVRTRVQKLLTLYKLQMFGDELFEYREIKLSTLPDVTVSFQTWQQMQDIERLQLASHHLQTFWSHLEEQRQLLREEKEHRGNLRRDKRGRPQFTLCQSFMGLQIDLRDLMRQVDVQLESLIVRQDPHSTKSTPTSPLYSTSTSVQPSTAHRSTERTTTHIKAPQSSTHFTTESTQTSTQLSPNTEKTFVGVTVTSRVINPTQTSMALHQRQRRSLSLESSRWSQHLKGYVILRDLERYLRRLARDYTVLQAKQN